MKTEWRMFDRARAKRDSTLRRTLRIVQKTYETRYPVRSFGFK